ncbi:hypothetical protein T12_6985, partial [Trichinella patagoniensis]
LRLEPCIDWPATFTIPQRAAEVNDQHSFQVSLTTTSDSIETTVVKVSDYHALRRLTATSACSKGTQIASIGGGTVSTYLGCVYLTDYFEPE